MHRMELSAYVRARRGRVTELAQALSVSGSLVTQWAGGSKPISVARCMHVERATGGAVRRWDLRPDDWHEIWPELIGSEGAPPLPVEVRDAA